MSVRLTEAYRSKQSLHTSRCKIIWVQLRSKFIMHHYQVCFSFSFHTKLGQHFKMATIYILEYLEGKTRKQLWTGPVFINNKVTGTV